MGAAGVGVAMSASMAAGAGAAGFAIGTMADIGTPRQKEFATKITENPGEIHIYPDQVYIKSNSPIHATVPTQKLREETLKDDDQRHFNFDMIIGNSQFTYKYDSYYMTDNDSYINIQGWKTNRK